MKYLKQLPSKSQLEEFVSSLDYKEPSVIEIGDEIIYNYRKKFLDSLVFDPDDYLSIYALEDGTFTYDATSNRQIEYSLNEGEWTVYSKSVECNAGDIIRLRGNNTNYYSGSKVFGYSGKFILYGNTDSLINSDKSNGFYVSSYAKNTFCYVFSYNSNLISIKYLTINANAQYSCNSMFEGCSTLVQVLDYLQAPTNTYCYARMFYGCSSLQDASNLTINASSSYCCDSMFYNCTSLEKIPTINVVNTGSSYMFQYMFYRCSSLKHAFDYFPNTGYSYSFRYMFANTSLKEAPKIRGAVWSYDFYHTFENCNITNLPPDYFDEVTYINGNYAFAYMFQNCTKLQNSPIISTQSDYSYTYYNMFNGCISLTSALPICDFHTTAYSFQNMFANCTSLTKGPTIFTNTVSSTSAFTSMFSGCSNLQGVGINLSKPDNNQSYSFPNWLQGTSPHGTIYAPFNSFVSGVDGLPEGWYFESYYPFNNFSGFSVISDLSLNSTGQEWYEFFDSLLNEYEYVYVVNSSSYKWLRVTKNANNAIYMQPINGAVGNTVITSDYTIYDNNFWSQNIPVGFLALNEPLQSAVIHDIM